MNPQIAQQYIQWFKKNEPFLFSVAANIDAIKNRGRGMGDWSTLFTSIADTVKNVAPALTQVYTQKKVLDAQLARAKAGLPPLETSQYAPTVKVEAGMTPEAEEAARRIAFETTKQGIGELKPFFLGALALGAFFLISKSRK